MPGWTATLIRARRLALAAVIAPLLALSLLASAGAFDLGSELRAFATQLGLRDIDGFAETVVSLRDTGKLPDRYIDKRRANQKGWKGSDLCPFTPGGSIGGDSFGNVEKRLPAAPRRRWREADLDYNCGARGARRLVWSNDGLFYVTLDHYLTFVRVPTPPP